METYKKNTGDIENFLIETIRNIGNLNTIESSRYNKLFAAFPSLELI